MADNVDLRLARAEDAPAVASVIHCAFAQYDGVLLPPSGAMSETAETVAARLGDEKCLIALAGSTPVGCVFYKEEGNSLYFGRLAVLPGRRGGGLARRLVAGVEAASRAAGAEAVTLGVRVSLPANFAMFTALGYRETGRTAHAGFSEPTSITMEKRILP
jgi:predicted GNAT superfamily acetyltransferase